MSAVAVLRQMGPTHNHRWTCGVGEEGDILGIWDEVGPLDLDVDSLRGQQTTAPVPAAAATTTSLRGSALGGIVKKIVKL